MENVVKCACGREVSKNGLSRHYKTKFHQSYLEGLQNGGGDLKLTSTKSVKVPLKREDNYYHKKSGGERKKIEFEDDVYEDEDSILSAEEEGEDELIQGILVLNEKLDLLSEQVQTGLSGLHEIIKVLISELNRLGDEDKPCETPKQEIESPKKEVERVELENKEN